MTATGAAAALRVQAGGGDGPPAKANATQAQRDIAAELTKLQRAVATQAPDVPKVTMNPDGKMTVVSPDGSTTIIYPDGRTTHVGVDGSVEQSAPPPASTEDEGRSSDGEVASMVSVTAVLAFFVGRWWGRRRWRKRGDEGATGAATAIGAVPADLGDRIDRIEHAVESVAIEVERISEGQRFTTKLLAERPEVGAAVPSGRRDQFAGGGK